MPHHPLFDIALADEYQTGIGSTALLAVRRFCWRSLKQISKMSAALLSLFLVVSLAAHSPTSAKTMLTETTPNKAMSMSVPRRLSNQPSLPSGAAFSPKDIPLSNQQSTEPPAKDTPFQTLRPKMTYHRLTTSRFSIPTDRSPTPNHR